MSLDLTIVYAMGAAFGLGLVFVFSISMVVLRRFGAPLAGLITWASKYFERSVTHMERVDAHMGVQQRRWEREDDRRAAVNPLDYDEERVVLMGKNQGGGGRK